LRPRGAPRDPGDDGERADRRAPKDELAMGRVRDRQPGHPSRSPGVVPPRAAVLVTGSELVRGGRVDENGPFLARALSSRGIEPERVSIIGDWPKQLEAEVRE